jgi:putative peptidoglycan lipid II flippase
VSKKLKNIGIVSLLTVGSRFLGLWRDQISAAIFGDSVFNSAFVTAFRLPNLFRRLLGEGSLTAAFLPTLQQELHDSGRTGAYALLNKVVSWLLLVTAAMSALAVTFFLHSHALIVRALELVYRVVSHASPPPGEAGKWFLVADLSAWLFPYLALVCVAAALNAALNVFERFTEPALSPIWLNLCMILTLGGAGYHFAHTPLGEMHWLCAGVLIGGFFQMTVPAGVLIREGWRPRWDLVLSPRVREIARRMGPGFFGTAIYQVNILVGSYLALSIDDNAATVMFYANRLMELPIGVFAIAVSTVVYPLIARHAAAGRPDAMADDYRKGIRLILIINVPAAVGLALLSLPITRLIYQHGRFDASATALMTPLLTLFVVGMPFFSVVNLTVRVFYAVKDLATPVRVATVDFFVNLVLSVVLMRKMGALGLVASSTIAIIIQTLLLQRALIKKIPQMSLLPLWQSGVKVLAGAIVMGVVVKAAWLWLQASGLSVHVKDLVAIGGLIPLGVAVYAISLWMLRIEGREDLEAILRRFKRKS